MDLKIFISYATATPGIVEILPKVAEEISKIEGCTAIYDQAALQGKEGQGWNDALKETIKDCHGTIFLLSHQSIQSEPVFREAACASEQFKLSRHYLLLPVFLPDGEGKNPSFGEKRWQDLALSASHAVRDHSSDNQMLAKMNQAIRNWKHNHPNYEPRREAYLENLPVSTTDEMFGREKDLQSLNSRLGQTNVSITYITADGGTGKSTLIQFWIDNLLKNRQAILPGTRVYAWSFYSQGTTDHHVSVDRFIDHACQWFGCPVDKEAGGTKRARVLAEYIRSHPTILLLDGMEPLQYRAGSLKGQWRDGQLNDFFNELLSPSDIKLFVLVTSRVVPHQLEQEKGRQPLKIFSLELNRIDDIAARALLKHGLKIRYPKLFIESQQARYLEETLENCVRLGGGHCFSLTLFAKFAAFISPVDPPTLDNLHKIYQRAQEKIEAQKIPEFVKGERDAGHAFRMIAGYVSELATSDRRRELEVLRLVGLFNRPVRLSIITEMLGEGGASFPLTPNLAIRNLKPFIEGLAVLGLLTFRPVADNDYEVDGHPLLREYFGAQLQTETFREGACIAHSRLFTILANCETYPNDSSSVDQLYWSIYHACQAGQFNEAFQVLRDRVWWKRIKDQEVLQWVPNDDRFLDGKERPPEAFMAKDYYFFPTRKLGKVQSDYVALTQFYQGGDPNTLTPAKELDKGYHFRLFVETGVRLRALGNLDLSIRLIAKAVEIGTETLSNSLEIRNKDILDDLPYANWTLSELYLSTGQLVPAESTAREAVALADQDHSTDVYQRFFARTSLAEALQYLGKEAEAVELLDQAVSIELDGNPRNPLMYSQSGFRYSSHLIRQGRYDDVARKYQDAEQRMRERQRSLARSKLSIAIQSLMEGRAILAALREASSIAAITDGLFPNEESFARLRRNGASPNVLGLIDQRLVQGKDHPNLSLVQTAEDLIQTSIYQFTDSGYYDYLVRGLATMGAITMAKIEFNLEQDMAREAELLAKAEQYWIRGISFADNGAMHLLKGDLLTERIVAWKRYLDWKLRVLGGDCTELFDLAKSVDSGYLQIVRAQAEQQGLKPI